MTDDRFAILLRSFSTTPSRRAVARGLSGLLISGVLAPWLGIADARGKSNQRRTRRGAHRGNRTRGGPVHADSAPVVIGPERDMGITENLIDCGTFMVHDRFDSVFTLRLFFDKAGNLVKGVEEVSGTDTFINATTGKELTGRFRNNVLIDFTSEPPLGANTGIIFKVTVPGSGAVFLDVGRIVTDRSGEIITFQKGPHQFYDGDFAGLCAALA